MLTKKTAALGAAIRAHVVTYGQEATEKCCKEALQRIGAEGVADKARADAVAAVIDVTPTDKARRRK